MQILTKDLINIAKCADRYSSRPALQCLCFDNGRVVATNSFELIEAALQMDDGEKHNQFLVNTDDILPQLSGKSKTICTILDKGEKVVFVLKNQKTGAENTFEVLKVNEDYPEFQSFLDEAKNRKPMVEVTLTAQYLALILKAMDNTGDSRITLSISGKNNPIVVTGQQMHNKDKTALIMPVVS